MDRKNKAFDAVKMVREIRDRQGASIPNNKGDNLSSSSAEGDSKPSFVRSLADIGPALVELKDIFLLGRLARSEEFGLSSFRARSVPR